MSYLNMNGFERLLYPTRIFILKSLVDKPLRFQKLKKDLGMKDESLWSNMRNLEQIGYVTLGKEIDEGSREAYTIYTITEKVKST